MAHQRTAEEQIVIDRAGEEIRRLRELAEMPQQALADVFGWQRDAVSKIERGVTNLSLWEFLRLVDYMRDVAGADHPALPLVDMMLHPKRNRPRLVKP